MKADKNNEEESPRYFEYQAKDDQSKIVSGILSKSMSKDELQDKLKKFNLSDIKIEEVSIDKVLKVKGIEIIALPKFRDLFPIRQIISLLINLRILNKPKEHRINLSDLGSGKIDFKIENLFLLPPAETLGCLILESFFLGGYDSMTITYKSEDLKIAVFKNNEKQDIPPPPASLCDGIKNCFMQLAGIEIEDRETPKESEIKILKEGVILRARIIFYPYDSGERIDFYIL